MQDLYPRIIRKWIYPLAQRLQHRDFPSLMAEALQNQQMSQDELQALQMRKLSALLEHAYRTVPHYQEKFDSLGIKPVDIRSLEDFSRIPILTKEELQQEAGRFISSAPRTPIYPVRTSGSTGRPTSFHLSQNAATAANVSRIRAQKWWGIDLGEREVRVWPIPTGLDPGFWTPYKRLTVRLFRDRLMNRRTFIANKISPEDMQNLWGLIHRHSPKVLFGYSTVILNFAHFLNEKGYDGQPLNLSAVVTSAEILYDRQLETIAETFGCPVVNEYGATEVGVIAYSHPCGELHTMDDYILVEVVKEDPQHEYGEIVITQLENWGSPLIRYNLQDLAVPSPDTSPCPLGVGFGKIKSVLGRQHDLIRLSDGRVVHGHFLANILTYVKNVRQFQVVQKELDKFEIYIKADDQTLTRDEERYLRTKILEYLGQVGIEITYVPEIPREDSGKFRFVRSELQVPPNSAG